MRIGIDAKFCSSFFGGLGAYSLYLIEALTKLNKDKIVAFVPRFIEEKLELPKGLNNLELHLIDVPIENPESKSRDEIRYIWDQQILPELLDNAQIDVFLGTAFIAPLNWNGTKVVVVHDRIFELSYKFQGTPDNYYTKWARICTENANAIITNSLYTERDIKENWNIKGIPISTIHLAPALSFIPNNKLESKAIIFEKYRVSDPYILHIGGWHPRKNLVHLIRVYATLAPTILRKTKLVIASETNKFAKILLKKYNIEDLVIFTNYVDGNTLPHLYAAAEMLVYPSFMEGFGMPPLEAMICGTPVITTNVGAIPEVVEDNVIYVKPDGQQELKIAIETLLMYNDIRVNMVCKGKKKASAYSWEKTALQTREFLEILNYK